MTASGHESDEQGIANAVNATGSGQKTATGHGESGLGETGIDPRIVTGLPESESERDVTGSGPKTATDRAATTRRRTANKTRPASDALDRLTASSKQSESENDGTGHGSCPTKSGLYDPSLFLDPKIGKHGRIENRSGPPKALSTHRIAGRAAMNGESQPRKRRGQGASAANEQPPSLQLPKGLQRQKHSLTPDEQPETLQPFSLDRGRAEGEEASRGATLGAPRGSPLLTCPPEGREEEEEEAPGCVTSEEVRTRGEASGTGGTEPEGRERLHSAYVCFIAKSSHCAGNHSTQKSQVMSFVHIFPLHLAQVGWGSLSNEDRNAPHFRPPTPGQILNSLDII